MERGEATIVFKGVPADVCDSCGEAFVGEEVSEEAYEQAGSRAPKGTFARCRISSLRRSKAKTPGACR